MAAKIISGIAVAVFERGRPVYAHTAGAANLEFGVPRSANTICSIASTTRQFTAAAILLLAEAGRLSLDDRLSCFVPEFPRAGELVLHQMLNHTSGLGDYMRLTSLKALQQAAWPDYDESAIIKFLLSEKPLFAFPPGTHWSHSNTGYTLLGVVVARASGKFYREFMQTHIFDPLGLADTAVDDAADIVPRRASGYTPNPKEQSGFDNASFFSRSFMGGAGSMRSTVLDLCRWYDALLSAKLLKPKSLRQMLAPARLADGSLPRDESLPTDNDGSPDEYGFGLYLAKIRGHSQIAHGGGVTGFLSLLYSFPDKAVTVAGLINCDDGFARTSRFEGPLEEMDEKLMERALA